MDDTIQYGTPHTTRYLRGVRCQRIAAQPSLFPFPYFAPANCARVSHAMWLAGCGLWECGGAAQPKSSKLERLGSWSRSLSFTFDLGLLHMSVIVWLELYLILFVDWTGLVSSLARELLLLLLCKSKTCDFLYLREAPTHTIHYSYIQWVLCSRLERATCMLIDLAKTLVMIYVVTRIYLIICSMIWSPYPYCRCWYL